MDKDRSRIEIHIPEKAAHILGTIHEAGFEAYVVGGCVRDSILGREPEDWDITTSARPLDIKRIFRRTIDTGIEHGTVTVMDGRDGFEVTTYRIDGEYADNRHPENVTFTASLREDLQRRDFTVNAMAYNNETGLVDIFGGMHDIREHIIRCVGEPEKRFGEDALRIMRAIRFSAQLDYTIEEGTAKAVMELAPTLSNISAERIQKELVKMLVSPHPEKLREAYQMGITKIIMPEFDKCMVTTQNNPHHMYTVGEHIIHSMENVRADKLLRLTMLFHDIGKPLCLTRDGAGIDHFHGHAAVSAKLSRKIMKRLKFDRDTMVRVSNLVANHGMDMSLDITPALMRHEIHDVGERDFPLLFEVKNADMMAQSLFIRQEKTDMLSRARQIYNQIIADGDCLSLKDLAVKGSDLIAAGMKPGKELGEVLGGMLEEVLDHPEHNAIEFLMNDRKPEDWRSV